MEPSPFQIGFWLDGHVFEFGSPNFNSTSHDLIIKHTEPWLLDEPKISDFLKIRCVAIMVDDNGDGVNSSLNNILII